jgi:hypothetical protein
MFRTTQRRAENFTHTNSAKRELAVNQLCKVKSVKTTLTPTRFIQVIKSNQFPIRRLRFVVEVFSLTSLLELPLMAHSLLPLE